jgi:hypothetical protein
MRESFDFDQGLEILRRTPALLRTWLAGLPEARTHVNEGPDTPFQPFDRFAQFEESRGKTLEDLLDAFERLRAESLAVLEGFGLTEADLDLKGAHPAFGQVTLRQLLATWVVHDLTHLAQVARVMAVQLRDEVGPWRKYLRVLGP